MFFNSNNEHKDNETTQKPVFFFIPIVERFKNINEAVHQAHTWRYASATNVYRYLYPSIADLKANEPNRDGRLLCYKVQLNDTEEAQLKRLNNENSQVYLSSLSFSEKDILSCVYLADNRQSEYINPFHNQLIMVEEEQNRQNLSLEYPVLGIRDIANKFKRCGW